MSLEMLTVLSQAPPILIVIVFVFYLLRELNRRDTKRDEVWRVFIKDWQVFIKDTIDAQQAAMLKISEVISILSEQVAKNTALMLLHDATVRGQNPSTIGTTEEIVEKLLRK